MICNHCHYCSSLKMASSLYTRTCVWHTNKHKWRWGYCHLFQSSCECSVPVSGETNVNLGASHIVHTWDGSGPFAHLFLWVFSLRSWWNAHIKLQSGIRWFWPQESTCEQRSQTLAAPEDTNIVFNHPISPGYKA